MRRGQASTEGNWEGGQGKGRTELGTRDTRVSRNVTRHYFN